MVVDVVAFRPPQIVSGWLVDAGEPTLGPAEAFYRRPARWERSPRGGSGRQPPASQGLSRSRRCLDPCGASTRYGVLWGIDRDALQLGMPRISPGCGRATFGDPRLGPKEHERQNTVSLKFTYVFMYAYPARSGANKN